MNLAYTISSSKDRTKKKGRHSHRFQDDDPKQSFKMLKDENGDYLKPPRFLPSGRLAYQSFSQFKDIAFVPVNSIPKDAVIAKPDLAWMQTLMHLQGGFLPPRLDLSWSNEQAVTQNGWCYVMDHAFAGATPRKRMRHRLPRNGARRRLCWSTASGTSDQREEMAAMYLRLFDHKEARKFDEPGLTLAKVVCNLRNYHGMSKEQTVMLIKAMFNPKLETPWSNEAICLAWELVSDYTPWLGITDVDGIARQKAVEIEDAVVDLLAHTRLGDRATTDAFFASFRAWNPDLKTAKTAVSHAVHEVAAIKTVPYRDEGRCYPGFHLPSTQELMDSAHATGDELDIAKLDSIIEWLQSLTEYDPFTAFNIYVSLYKRWFYSPEMNSWVRKSVMRPVKLFALSQVSPLQIHAFSPPHLITQEKKNIDRFVKSSWRANASSPCLPKKEEADDYFEIPDFILRTTLLGLLVYRDKSTRQPLSYPELHLTTQGEHQLAG